MATQTVQIKLLPGVAGRTQTNTNGIVTSIHVEAPVSSGLVTVKSPTGANLLGNYAEAIDTAPIAPGAATLSLADLGGVVVNGAILVSRTIDSGEITLNIGLSQV